MMLFDLEDYATSGWVGHSRHIPEKKLPNKMTGVNNSGLSDAWFTATATGAAHLKALTEYVPTALGMLPMELRDAAIDKYFEAIELYREYRIASKEYWHMMHSLPVVKVHGGIQFQPGDWFYVIDGNIDSLDYSNECAYILNHRGNITPWYDINHPQYKYNSDALLYMSGKKFEYKAVRCGGENIYNNESAPGAPGGFHTIKYTPYSETIESNYYSKIEAFIACEKQLFIALEGFNPFVTE